MGLRQPGAAWNSGFILPLVEACRVDLGCWPMRGSLEGVLGRPGEGSGGGGKL